VDELTVEPPAPALVNPPMRPVLPLGPELVEVRRIWGGAQADLVKSLLEAHGIACALMGEGKDGAYNLTVGALAEVRLMVAPKDVGAAESILLAADRGEFTLDE